MTEGCLGDTMRYIHITITIYTKGILACPVCTVTLQMSEFHFEVMPKRNGQKVMQSYISNISYVHV